MRQFGRLHVPDERDGKYPMRALLAPAPLRLYRYWWDNGWHGDQGDTPQCVAYSWIAWLEDGPITHHDVPAPCIVPHVLYDLAQQLDEWPGEGYAGTSVRGAAKALVHMGRVSEYRWAWDIETLIEAVLNVGPVVMGTNWYSGMFHADHDDVLHPTGSLVGGHAYVVNGVNLRRGLVRIKNSWGRTWSGDGRAMMAIEDLDRLLREDGEACLAVEIAS